VVLLQATLSNHRRLAAERQSATRERRKEQRTQLPSARLQVRGRVIAHSGIRRRLHRPKDALEARVGSGNIGEQNEHAPRTMDHQPGEREVWTNVLRVRQQ
jgi:hypothetical protein